MSELDYDEIAKLLMDTVVDTMLVDHCSLFLLDTSGAGFVNFAYRGKQIYSGGSISMDKDNPLIKFMKNHRQFVKRKNLRRQTSVPKIQDVLSDMDALGAEIALPMIFKENLNGFIVLGGNVPEIFLRVKIWIFLKHLPVRARFPLRMLDPIG